MLLLIRKQDLKEMKWRLLKFIWQIFYELRYFLLKQFCRYGVRVTTEECPVAVFVMSVQSIVGVIIQVNFYDHSQNFIQTHLNPYLLWFSLFNPCKNICLVYSETISVILSKHDVNRINFEKCNLKSLTKLLLGVHGGDCFCKIYKTCK